MTTVKHEEYWPAILADPTKYGQIQTADAAWNARAACVFEVLKNTLCARDNAILTQQWENTLELSPADGAPLNERKAVILYRLTEAPPLTIALLEKSLVLLMGEGKAVVEHLPAENKLVVHTDRADDTQLVAVTALLERVLPQNVEVVRYNHTFEISWRDINKYAECVTPMDMYAVSPETTKIVPNNFGAIYLTTDFCSDGTWAYPLPKLETVNCGGWNVNVFRSYKLPEFVIELPNLKQWCGGISVDETWKTKRTIVYAPKVERVYSLWEAHSTYFYITADNVKIFSDNAFSKNHTQFDFELPKLENGAGGFNNSAMNKESTLRILNSIPAYTSGSHKLTIGIHVDHKADDEVLAAIANAEAKGWSLTVQWNGTPTAQASVTYGLRTPPIYARVEERELPDGTTERVLDWGHYVTDPTGYEEFRSVEEAREHYGLPAEDEPKEETTE
jgi:hypothetical protein